MTVIEFLCAALSPIVVNIAQDAKMLISQADIGVGAIHEISVRFYQTSALGWKHSV